MSFLLTRFYTQKLEAVEKQGEIRGERRGERRGELRGERRATCRLITNLLEVRFSGVDEELTTIIEPLLELPSEEFTPLLLQLSREDLLARFGNLN